MERDLETIQLNKPFQFIIPLRFNFRYLHDVKTGKIKVDIVPAISNRAKGGVINSSSIFFTSEELGVAVIPLNIVDAPVNSSVHTQLPSFTLDSVKSRVVSMSKGVLSRNLQAFILLVAEYVITLIFSNYFYYSL